MPENRKSCPSHCCERHGCKYGYEDCPVENKEVAQEGPCEYCPSLEDIQAYLKYYQEELKFWELLNARKTKEVINQHRQAMKEKKDVR